MTASWQCRGCQCGDIITVRQVTPLMDFLMLILRAHQCEHRRIVVNTTLQEISHGA